MDTAEIEVFLTLAEELHFGRTAERLHMPQSQVHRLVARLERRAGGALFDRTSRPGPDHSARRAAARSDPARIHPADRGARGSPGRGARAHRDAAARFHRDHA